MASAPTPQMIRRDHTPRSIVELAASGGDKHGFQRHFIVWTLFIAMASSVVLVIFDATSGYQSLASVVPHLLGFSACIVALLLARSARWRTAGVLAVAGLIVVITAAGISGGGLIAPHYVWYATAIVMADYLLGRRAALGAGLLACALVAGVQGLESAGVLAALFAIGPLPRARGRPVRAGGLYRYRVRRRTRNAASRGDAPRERGPLSQHLRSGCLGHRSCRRGFVAHSDVERQILQFARLPQGRVVGCGLPGVDTCRRHVGA